MFVVKGDVVGVDAFVETVRGGGCKRRLLGAAVVGGQAGSRRLNATSVIVRTATITGVWAGGGRGGLSS